MLFGSFLSRLLGDHLIDFDQVNRVLLIQADIAIAHDVDLQATLVLEVFRKEDNHILRRCPLKGNSLQTKQLFCHRIGDHHEPRCFFELREVRDRDCLRMALVHSSEINAELGLSVLFKLLSFKWFVQLIYLDDGPSDLRDRYSFKGASDLCHLLWLIEFDASPCEDFIDIL